MFNIFKSNTKDYEGKNFYSFCCRNSNGEEIQMNSFIGKVCLVVNVASQYEEAEPSALNFPTTGLVDENFKQLCELDKRYRDQGLVILGFPTNQFAGQEPALQEEIVSFIKRKYNVDFEIYQKIDVNGQNTHPLFDYLKTILTGTITNDLKWHFTKFLIDRNGNPVKRYAPNDSPFSFEEEIRHLLRQECVFLTRGAAGSLPAGQGLQGQELQGQGLQGQTREWEKEKELRGKDWEREKELRGKDWEKERELKEQKPAVSLQGQSKQEVLAKDWNKEQVAERSNYQGNVGNTEFGLHKEKTKDVTPQKEKSQSHYEGQVGNTQFGLHTEKKEVNLPGQEKSQSHYQGQVGNTQFGLHTEKKEVNTDQQKELDTLRQRELEREKQMKSSKKSTLEEKDLGGVEQKKMGEGGLIGAQMGIHIGGHSLQTGIQAGKDTSKAQEQTK